MPFKSNSQRKLCYLLKGKGQAGSWDCEEWSIATGKKKLPEHVADQEEKLALEATNKIVGGDGDNKKPSDFSKSVLDEGVEDEKEHTNDLDIAREIAIDHLSKDPEYYKKIKLVEGIDKKSEVSSLISKWSGMSGRAQYSIEVLQGLLKDAAGGPPPRTDGYKPPSVFSTPPRLAVGAPPAGTPAGGTPAPAPAAAANAPPSGVMGYANQAWNSAKSGVSGVMGNVQSSPAYNNSSLAYQNRGAIAPTAWNAVQAGFGSDEAKTKLDADANRFNWSALKDNATKAWNDPSTQNGIKKMQGNMEASVAENYKKNLSWADKQRLIEEYKLTPVEAAQAAFKKGLGYDRITSGETARIKGDMSKWTAGLGDSISKSPFGVAANYVGTGVKNYATQSEAKRMTAQATMPYVDWMRANPWAKYVGGGLALGAGAYGLHKLFGGGGGAAETDEDEDGNILTKSFNRGLNPAPVGRSKRYW